MSNKIGKKCLAMLLTAVLAVTMLAASGCSNDVELKLTTGLTAGELFRIDRVACTEAEARLFLMNQRNHYEASYGENIWDVSLGQETFAQYMDDRLEDFLIQLKTMVRMAESRNITLSDDEKNRASSAAVAYLGQLTEEAKTYLNMTEEQLTGLFREYRLAERLVAQVTAGVAEEISDDEARVIEVQQIVWHKYQTNEAGEKIRLSDREINDIRETAKAVADRAMGGESFSHLQEFYSQGQRGAEQLSRHEAESVWKETVFALGSGEVSSLIETEDGFYVVRCVNNLLSQETLTNKDVIRERQKAEVFYGEYNIFVKSVLAQYNTEALARLSFTGEIPSCQADFYAVYEEYFS